jgi:hypothetical protein
MAKPQKKDKNRPPRIFVVNDTAFEEALGKNIGRRIKQYIQDQDFLLLCQQKEPDILRSSPSAKLALTTVANRMERIYTNGLGNAEYVSLVVANLNKYITPECEVIFLKLDNRLYNSIAQQLYENVQRIELRSDIQVKSTPYHSPNAKKKSPIQEGKAGRQKQKGTTAPKPNTVEESEDDVQLPTTPLNIDATPIGMADDEYEEAFTDAEVGKKQPTVVTPPPQSTPDSESAQQSETEEGQEKATEPAEKAPQKPVAPVTESEQKQAENSPEQVTASESIATPSPAPTSTTSPSQESEQPTPRQAESKEQQFKPEAPKVENPDEAVTDVKEDGEERPNEQCTKNAQAVEEEPEPEQPVSSETQETVQVSGEEETKTTPGASIKPTAQTEPVVEKKAEQKPPKQAEPEQSQSGQNVDKQEENRKATNPVTPNAPHQSEEQPEHPQADTSNGDAAVGEEERTKEEKSSAPATEESPVDERLEQSSKNEEQPQPDSEPIPDVQSEPTSESKPTAESESEPKEESEPEAEDKVDEEEEKPKKKIFGLGRKKEKDKDKDKKKKEKKKDRKKKQEQDPEQDEEVDPLADLGTDARNTPKSGDTQKKGSGSETKPNGGTPQQTVVTADADDEQTGRLNRQIKDSLQHQSDTQTETKPDVSIDELEKQIFGEAKATNEFKRVETEADISKADFISSLYERTKTKMCTLSPELKTSMSYGDEEEQDERFTRFLMLLLKSTSRKDFVDSWQASSSFESKTTGMEDSVKDCETRYARILQLAQYYFHMCEQVYLKDPV